MSSAPAPQTSIPIGWRGPRYVGRIDPDAAVAYANATNDPNSAYQTGAAVPPLFTAALVLEAQQEVHRSTLDPTTLPGFQTGVHAEHDVRFFAPVVPGMSLGWQAGFRSIRPTPAGPLMTVEVQVCDADGRALLEHLWSTIYIGGRFEEALGPELPDHRFPRRRAAVPPVAAAST